MLDSQKVYKMLGNENLWETAIECHQLLAEASIAHSVWGCRRLSAWLSA